MSGNGKGGGEEAEASSLHRCPLKYPGAGGISCWSGMGECISAAPEPQYSAREIQEVRRRVVIHCSFIDKNLRKLTVGAMMRISVSL